MWSGNANLTVWDGWDRGFQQFVDPAQLDPINENLVDWPSFARNHDNSTPWRLLQATRHAITSDVPTLTALRQGYQYWSRNRAKGGTESIINRVNKTNFESQEFLLVNLMETHTPYHPPDGSDPVQVIIADAFAENVKNPKYIKRAYEESVNYLDEKLEDLFSNLRKEFDYIITVGDHGEMLGEGGMWNHGYGLYPELVHVPLVISGDNVSEASHDGIVSLLDIHKTIADLTDIDVDSRGRNLLDSPKERPLLTEYHGFRPAHRNQFERKGAPSGTYDRFDTDLNGVVLPEGYAYETHSEGIRVSGGMSESRARSEIRTLKKDLDIRNVSKDTEEIDEATKRQLRELGYA
jgi:arylsulfatase